MPLSQILLAQNRYPKFLKTKLEQMHTCHQHKEHKLCYINAHRPTTCPLCGTAYDHPPAAVWHQCHMETLYVDTPHGAPRPIYLNKQRRLEYKERITTAQIEQILPILEQCQNSLVKEWLQHKENTMLLHPNTIAMVKSDARQIDPPRIITVGNICISRIGPPSHQGPFLDERTHPYVLKLGQLLGHTLYNKWIQMDPRPEERFPKEVLHYVNDAIKHTKKSKQTTIYDYMNPKQRSTEEPY